jgi:uncharacterized ion transporter superfamily protein YfcC
MPSTKFRLPHPVVLLGAAVAVAAALTWILPAGEYERRDDPATGRRVVVAGTYHPVDPAPVGPFAAFVAMPRGVVAAADVVGVVLFVGGAWVIVDRLGTLPAVVGLLVGAVGGRRLWMIPIVSLFFATMGALENMQEEIIPLVPALLLLGAGLKMDPVAVVAMSAGAAMVGSAFGPTNPFQAGIAMKLAQLPPFSAVGLRLAMFAVGVGIWIAWTIRYVRTQGSERSEGSGSSGGSFGAVDLTTLPVNPGTIGSRRHLLILTLVLLPMAFYVYGALNLNWGFNELSAAFLIGGLAAGMVGGMSLTRTVIVYLEGMETLLPAALMVGVARSISIVLEDGRVIDTILAALVNPLSGLSPLVAAILMVPFHALIHVVVPSVSGHAVLTMPLFVPMADVLGMSRQVPVLAYQTGAGLMELATPTNGSLMAILLAAGVPFLRWIRFALGGILLLTLLGVGSLAIFF